MTVSPGMWGMMALALALRLGLLTAAGAESGRLYQAPDSQEYERLALNLLAHGRFSQAAGPPFDPDHTRTPVYPALLAGLWAVTGYDPMAAAVLNVLTGTATVAALVLLGARVAPTAALVAGALLALDPTSASYSVLLLTESVFTFLLTTAVMALLAGRARDGVGWAAGTGVLLGLATLTRPLGAYLPLLLAGTLLAGRGAAWRKRVRAMSVLLLGACLLTGAWVLRNHLTGGGLSLSSIAAVNLYYHRAAAVLADAAGISRDEARRRLAVRLEQAVAADGLAEGEARRLMSAWALEIIGADPWRYLRLHLEGILRMLGPDPEALFQLLGRPGRGAGPPSRPDPWWWTALAVEGAALGALYVLAGVGAVACAKTRQSWLVLPAVLTIGYACLVGGPEVYARFRVPLMPCFAWLAGLGLARVAPGRQG